MYNTQSLEDFLKNIDELEIIQKIKKFRGLNFYCMTNEEIANAISNTLMYNNKFVYISNIQTYPANTKFFRVRLLEGSHIPNKNLSTVSDFWNPPKEAVTRYGRLNKIGESLLYTSPMNPFISIKEMKLPENAYYALIIYKAKYEIKANLIGGEYDYDALNVKDKKMIMINELYNNFLRDEFSRDVGVGTEYLYQISEIIAKWYFDLPPRDVQDAWAYASVQDKTKYNVCFRPNIAKELLELQGSVIARNDDPKTITAVAVTHGFNIDGIAQFYAIGSDIQNQYFPEIQQTEL